MEIMATLGLMFGGMVDWQVDIPEIGMSVPSGHCTNEEPPCIPPSPEFSLPDELARMQEQGAASSNRPLPNQLVPLQPGQ